MPYSVVWAHVEKVTGRGPKGRRKRHKFGDSFYLSPKYGVDGGDAFSGSLDFDVISRIFNVWRKDTEASYNLPLLIQRFFLANISRHEKEKRTQLLLQAVTRLHTDLRA